jgi:hypothetical protein
MVSQNTRKYLWRQCCGTPLVLCAVWRIREVYPGSRILIFTHPGSRISDPGSKNSNDIGEKKFVVIPFFWSHKFHEIELKYFILKCWRKKFGPIFQKIIELLTQKIVSKLSKIWVWDPGSEIRDPEKPFPDPGFRGQKGTGSRIRIRNTGYAYPDPPGKPTWKDPQPKRLDTDPT